MSVVRGLKASYKDFQIEIPHWEILDQGITALWGPSGSGKTSVFRLLLGLEQASQPFSWMHHDVDLAQLPTPARHLGVVFQSLELFPHMTALENIEFAALARKIPRDRQQSNSRSSLICCSSVIFCESRSRFFRAANASGSPSHAPSWVSHGSCFSMNRSRRLMRSCDRRHAN